MSIFKKKYQVKPNTIGYLYRNHAFEKKLTPGYYKIADFNNRTELFVLPLSNKMISITNQEVLTKDNIALRFSFNITYRITDGEKFLSKFALDKPVHSIISEAEGQVYNTIQIIIRNKISGFESETLNEKRVELTECKTEEMEKLVSEFGITLEQVQLRDITFPKSIQDLFARHLEAKIRAKADLENARTAVATARALKNASEIMKDDDNIKFFQMLETITKIAEKGKHTFVIGDIQNSIKI
jgi:regulator of protease activity HflC (stomatin/prohibitin superfamily)